MNVMHLRTKPLPREYEGTAFRVVQIGQHQHSPDEEVVCRTIGEARHASRYLPQDARVKLVKVED